MDKPGKSNASRRKDFFQELWHIQSSQVKDMEKSNGASGWQRGREGGEGAVRFSRVGRNQSV